MKNLVIKFGLGCLFILAGLIIREDSFGIGLSSPFIIVKTLMVIIGALIFMNILVPKEKLMKNENKGNEGNHE